MCYNKGFIKWAISWDYGTFCRKVILQTRMHSNLVGLDVWFLVRPFVYFHTLCMQTVWMRRLAWAFAGHLCDEYHNLMSWLKGLRYTLKYHTYACLWHGKHSSFCGYSEQTMHWQSYSLEI